MMEFYCLLKLKTEIGSVTFKCYKVNINARKC